MIDGLVLAFAMLQQPVVTIPPPAYSPFTTKHHDITFMCSVEQSIAREHGKAPPEPFASLIEELGSECYVLRESSYDRLVKASAKNPRWLFWGLLHRDVEVRLYCNKALWQLSECSTCRGTGECEFDSEWDPWTEDWATWCRSCHESKRWHNNIACRKCAGRKRFWDFGVKE
jgi:hypothetical protein